MLHASDLGTVLYAAARGYRQIPSHQSIGPYQLTGCACALLVTDATGFCSAAAVTLFAVQVA